MNYELWFLICMKYYNQIIFHTEIVHKLGSSFHFYHYFCYHYHHHYRNYHFCSDWHDVFPCRYFSLSLFLVKSLLSTLTFLDLNEDILQFTICVIDKFQHANTEMFALVGRYHATSTYSTSPPEDIKRPMMNTMVLVGVCRKIESWDDKVYHL